MPVSQMVLVGSYDWRSVASSIVITLLAAYAGLDLAERVTAAHGRVRMVWLAGGVTATAVGTWSMHYAGMLSDTAAQLKALGDLDKVVET
jgi:NO-binding membrane sensor protein with MHYT domain